MSVRDILILRKRRNKSVIFMYEILDDRNFVRGKLRGPKRVKRRGRLLV